MPDQRLRLTATEIEAKLLATLKERGLGETESVKIRPYVGPGRTWEIDSIKPEPTSGQYWFADLKEAVGRLQDRYDLARGS